MKKRSTANYKDTLKYSLCWTCRNACGGCSWSRDFQPVKGWEAVPTYHISNGEHANSFHVYKCPLYKEE